MLQIKRWTTVFASVAALACSAADETGSGQGAESAEAPSEASEGLVLNELSVAGETLQFLEYNMDGANPLFTLRAQGSAYVKQDLLTRLEAEVGELTLLETFYAIAPAGATPHADLERYHLEEVVALQRPDASVRRVTFDVDRPVEKSATACDTYANSNRPAGITWWAPANNQANMVNGGNLGRLCRASNGRPGCDVLGTDAQLVAACNDGPGDILVFHEWRSNTQGWRRDSFVVRVTPGGKIHWKVGRTSGLDKLQTIGIQVQDDPDFISPAYYARARASQV